MMILILLTISLSLAIGFLITFLYTTSKGQFDDLDTPPVRILFDDENHKKN